MGLKVEKLRVHGLEPVSFELEEGECLAVRGASGAGKSLLLRAIADLDLTPGRVSIDGRRREDMEAARWRSLVRYVAAESGWWEEKTGAHFRDLEKSRRRAARLGIGAELFEAPVSRLSSGERQRLALVRALEDEPRFLLLDEPTSSLDEQSERLVEEEIRKLLSRGRGVIVVTHGEKQAQRLADRILRIEKGRWHLEPPEAAEEAGAAGLQDKEMAAGKGAGKGAEK